MSTPAPSAEAFSALFDEHHRAIWAFLRRRVGNGIDADDLSAEVFTVVWRRWSRLPPPDERKLWLFGIARNLLRNHRRSLDRRKRLVSRLTVVTERELRVDPVERTDELWIALAALTEADRDLLIMRAWDQLAVTEIAKLLGCTPNAVSMRLHKARSRLKDQLHQKDQGHKKDLGHDGDEANEPLAKGERR